MTIFGVEQTLNTVHIVGVLFLLRRAEAQFIQHLVLTFCVSVTEASFCFAQYSRIPAALFMLLEVND